MSKSGNKKENEKKNENKNFMLTGQILTFWHDILLTINKKVAQRIWYYK